MIFVVSLLGKLAVLAIYSSIDTKDKVGTAGSGGSNPKGKTTTLYMSKVDVCVGYRLALCLCVR